MATKSKASAAAAAAGPQTYIVRRPVEHNGDRYEVDAEIELDGETAATLIAAGAIVAKGDAPAN